MRILSASVLICSIFAAAGLAQKAASFPAGVPVKETGIEASGGKVEGRTYTNRKFEFTVTVPDDWYIGGADFEKVLKDNGHDIGTEAVVRSGRSVDVLFTAFRSEKDRPGAVLRVTAENLSPHPQIRDAVDYFDAITAVYASIKLPEGFAYSAVKAEALGTHQFAYLDVSTSAGKKRLYATVRGGWAIMFTLSYFEDADLHALRDMLARGEFAKRSPKN